jgi:GT2 family glycosyltransferase
MTNSNKSKHNLPLVSVIVLNYNGKRFLDRCLGSLLHTNYPNFEIIFFDNNSIDGSLEFLQKTFGNDPRIRVVKNKINSGFASGNNVAANYAKGKYSVFLNNDTEVDSYWLQELVNVMELDPNIGAAQSRLLQLDKKHYDSAGDFLCPWGLSLRRGEGTEDRGQYNQVEEIFSARGAAMITRSQVFRGVGMFDPIFFLQLEDLDLCWRIRLHGYKIVFVPKSIVYHKGGSALKNVPRGKSEFMSQRNRLLMAIKNYSILNLVKYFPIILMMTLFGFVFENGSIRCRMKALSWIVVNFPKVWTERSTVQCYVRTVPDSQILKHMLKICPVTFLKNYKKSTMLNRERICLGGQVC